MDVLLKKYHINYLEFILYNYYYYSICFFIYNNKFNF